MGPQKIPGGPMVPGTDGPAGHSFVEAPPEGWDQIALMEWELTGESWTDRHPHDEYNYVLEGRLFVTCDGQTVEAEKGDVVRVPAGTTGRYWAPEHARMLGVYGPNPQGLPSSYLGFDKLGQA